MNNAIKKSVSVILALLMILTIAPMSIFAEEPCKHENVEIKSLILATCTTKGRNEGLYCNDCNTYLDGGEEIPALGHNFVMDKTVVATCTEDGYVSFKCIRCPETKKENVVPAKGHDYTEVITKPATCSTAGTKTLTCKNCGTSKTETIAKLSHNYVETVKKANCTEAGYNLFECSVCGDKYKTNDVPALGHDFGEWVITTSGDCEHPQVKTRTCKREGCGKTETQTSEKRAHDYVKTVVQPTCVSSGYTEYKCKNCDDVKQENFKPALDHDRREEPAEEPTCNAEGRTEKVYCARCGDVFLEPTIIPKTDHKLMVVSKLLPTCTTPGRTEGKQCEYCGEIFAEIKEIPPTGHKYEENVIKAPDCVNQGLSEFRCTECADNFTKVVDAKGHDYSKEWTIDQQETCETPGVKSRYCNVCGARTDITEINALGGKHSWRTEWTIDKAATCEATGLKSHHCIVCDAKTDITTIPKAHNYVITTTKATTTKNGLVEKKCTICGNVSSSRVIEKIASITISATSYTCDGKTKTPTVTVKNSSGSKLANGTDYTVKYQSGRKAVGTYNVVVTFKGKYSGSKILKFTINLGKVKGVEIKANKGKNTVTLNYDKVTGAKKYVAYYATSKDGKYKKLGSTTKTTYTTRKFTAGKTIYFKVKAYTVNDTGKGVYGDYSSAVKAKIK